MVMILQRTSERGGLRPHRAHVSGAVVPGPLPTTFARPKGGGTTLIHHIVRMRSATTVTGPALGVAEVASGKSPQERLRHLLPPDRVPARVPLVLLWRGDPLSSPDTIVLKGAHKSGQEIDVQIELRRFDGTLHANTVTVPIVEVALGVLEPGRYKVSVAVTELWFSDLDHPENAAPSSTQHTSFSFVVV
jgi:hypothetical protein